MENLVIQNLFSSLVEALGRPLTFLGYTLLTAACTAVLYSRLPETKVRIRLYNWLPDFFYMLFSWPRVQLFSTQGCQKQRLESGFIFDYKISCVHSAHGRVYSCSLLKAARNKG